ncbi:MAG: hypothetical protein LBJ00_03250 [Planctomycetaceae bacterium]|nr:hypothetical protein [Planctomycetaceae bacterium]
MKRLFKGEVYRPYRCRYNIQPFVFYCPINYCTKNQAAGFLCIFLTSFFYFLKLL